MEIKSGMVVWLKSGSPAMTVKNNAMASKDLWNCNWFVGDTVHKEVFT
jgi:uncharacterized protein YodC (DUF2158 family)